MRKQGGASGCARAAAAVLAALLPLALAAIDASDSYRSPRNPERKVRASTELIVLHTTEAPAKSSLNKLCERGEAHYCVTEDGRVYRIVDRDREAYHAGRSMWKGKEDVDKFSIGIECVGYHDKPMPSVQLTAIRDLVRELKEMYRLKDDCVVCHSHVAYGAPNRWQKKRHRGRKRCGMLFAMASVRRCLELKSRPASDADVAAKRLVIADDMLNRVLYGTLDTMVGKVSTSSVKPPPAKSGSWLDWLKPAVPSTTAVAAAKPAASSRRSAAARPPAAPKADASKRGGQKPSAELPPKSIAELKARNFKLLGKVTASVTASKIAGCRWNAADTYYTIRDKVMPGNTIDSRRIEKGMGIWRKK